MHDEEATIVAQINQQLISQGETFPTTWRDADTLRFVHEFDFNRPLITQKIREHLQWLRTGPGRTLSDQAKFMSETGVVYQLGRDTRFRPNVYMILRKLNNFADNLPFIIEALLHTLVLVREKMLLSYHVEKWNLFVDCTNSNELASGANILGNIYEAIRSHFPMTLEKIFILGAGMMEAIAAQFNPYQSKSIKDKVVILENINDPELASHITKDQLQQVYGGQVPEPAIFWPPPQTYNRNTVSRATAEKRKLFFFKMHDREIDASAMGTQSEYRPTGASAISGMNDPYRASSPAFIANGGSFLLLT